MTRQYYVNKRKTLFFEKMESILNLRLIAIFYLRLICNSDLRKTLKNNAKFKNIHKGKRIFIIGNGPSLLKADLNQLQDQIVVTVNQSIRSDIYQTLKPSYHIMADPAYGMEEAVFFNGQVEDVVNILRSKSKPVLFMPFRFKSIYNRRLTNTKKIHYFYDGIQLVNKANFTIDFSKIIPYGQNIIHYAIYLSFFLGASEIYLLGCDMTHILKQFKKNDKGSSSIEEHFYKYNDTDIKISDLNFKYESFEFFYECLTNTYRIFRRLQEMGRRKGVTIIDLTENGYLEAFPKRKLNEIVQKSSDEKIKEVSMNDAKKNK